MIRFIVAIDQQQGLANDEGMPWDLPTDRRYFRDQTMGDIVLMGYGTYITFTKPLEGRCNLVATTRDEKLRAGFDWISNARTYLADVKQDVWVIGGAELYASTFSMADELYIAQLEGEFGCTKFFPEYRSEFVCSSQSKPLSENGIIFRYEKWERVVKKERR